MHLTFLTHYVCLILALASPSTCKGLTDRLLLYSTKRNTSLLLSLTLWRLVHSAFRDARQLSFP